MEASVKHLDYLNLEVRAERRVQVEQYNLPCFCKSSVEHFVHTQDHPQLNLVVDLLFLIIQQQKQLLFSTSSVQANKVIRDVHDKLEYLRDSLNSFHLKSAVKQLETSLKLVEQQTQQCHVLLKQLHDTLL